MKMNDILNHDAEFRYKLLDRLRIDCEYYLGNGQRNSKNLWALDEADHIACMKALWNSFDNESKPNFLPYEQICYYEKEMVPITLFKVGISNYSDVKVFGSYARNEEDAISNVAAYIKERDLDEYYCDYYDIFDICDNGETVDEYCASHNMAEYENGVYMSVSTVENIKEPSAELIASLEFVNQKAILVERDYKGVYERFALTPEEFAKEFPETYKNFGSIETSDTDTIAPLVHIWFDFCVTGDNAWHRHFTDMAYGLPESDIESGNLASIREDMMQSLKDYLPKTEITLDDQIRAAKELSADKTYDLTSTALNKEFQNESEHER